MGPSPFSDGRSTAVNAVVRKGTLQWGHRLSAMEGGAGAYTHFPLASASMGPSPFSDGRRPLARGPPGWRSASMGPSPFSDGRATAASSSTRIFLSFNGAIAFQRWKGDDQIKRISPVNSFNGAIAFQRWKAARGAEPHQIGRAASMGPSPFSDGRWEEAEKADAAYEAASMGPSPFSDGRSGIDFVTIGIHHASMGPSPFSDGRKPRPMMTMK